MGPLFLATKLEAFRTRGKSDSHTSHDWEDIVAVIDGREELVREMEAADPDFRQYLAAEFAELIQGDDFRSSLAGHFLPDEVSEQRVDFVLSRLRQMAGMR